MAIELPFEIPKDNPVYINIQKFSVTYQKLVDESVPYTSRRWIGFGILLSLFLLRIFISRLVYNLLCFRNLFIEFILSILTPKFDPSLEQELKNESIEEGLDQEDPISQQSNQNMMMMMMMSLDHL